MKACEISKNFHTFSSDFLSNPSVVCTFTPTKVTQMEEMQFAAIVLMSILTLTLVFLLPKHSTSNVVISYSRWLMAGGTALLTVQFFLQYYFHFRQMGVTQGALVNLLFFVPATWLLSLSILWLQRQGRIDVHLWLPGLLAWILTSALLVIAAIINIHPLWNNTIQMRTAEYVSGFVYFVVNTYYMTLLILGNRRLRRALNNYYDNETDGMLYWMERSVLMLSLIVYGVPIIIFFHGFLLITYALLIFYFIYYLVFCFVCYVVSNDSKKVNEAETNAVKVKMDEKNDMSVDDIQRMTAIVDRWVASGGYLKSGITMQTVVAEMHIPRYQLAAWLKTTEWELFNPWLTHLRIEEAKRVMKEHPDWSNDAIATQCGFSSRTYFQKVFRMQTGMTPSEFVER